MPTQCIASGPWRRMRCMVMAVVVPDAGAGARKCVSASVSRCKKVWNINGGGTHAVCAAALHDHAQEHGSVDFHPVLALFATGGRGGALTMWQLNCYYTSIHCVAVVNLTPTFKEGGGGGRGGLGASASEILKTWRVGEAATGSPVQGGCCTTNTRAGLPSGPACDMSRTRLVGA